MNANDSAEKSTRRLARTVLIALLGGALLGLGAWTAGALALPRSEATALPVQADTSGELTSGRSASSPGAIRTPSGPNR